MRGTCKCAVRVKSEKFLDGGLWRVSKLSVGLESSCSGLGRMVDKGVPLSSIA